MKSVAHNKKIELIKIKLSAILIKWSTNPSFDGVTISRVKLSPDGSSAVVFFSIFSPNIEIGSITRALNHAAGFFQSKLAKSLKIRNTPHLSFVYDIGFDHAGRIDKIIAELKEKDQGV